MITQIIFSLRGLPSCVFCVFCNFFESLYLSFCGSGEALEIKESQLLRNFKTLNIRFSRFILKTILWQSLDKERKPKTPKVGLINTKGFVSNDCLLKSKKPHLL